MLNEYPKDVLGLLARLVAIDSQSSIDNTAIIALLNGWFEGYEKWIQEWVRESDGVNGKNLIVKIPGEASHTSLVFLCHIDTVPPSSAWKTNPFILEEIESRLYGLGTSDTKGGVAALIHSVLSLTKKPAVDTYLVFDGDEESTWTGAKMFQKDYHLLNPVFIAVEPTDKTLCVGARSILECTITTRGTSIHASFGTPELNEKESAIYKMNRIMNALISDAKTIANEKDEIMGSNSQNLGMISGGTARNVIPDICVVSVDRRLLPNKNIENELFRIKEMVAAQDPQAIVSGVFYQRGFKTKENTPLISKLVEQVAKVVPEIKIGSFQAMSEVTLFQEEGECVVLGPGSIAQAHRANEFIESKELFDYVKVYQDIIENITI